MLLPSAAVWLLFWPISSLAQNYKIPPQWINTTSSESRVQRAQRSKDVLDALSALYDPSTGQIKDLEFVQNAHLLSATSAYDRVTSSSTYRDAVNEYYFKVISQFPPFSETRAVGDPLTWGLAGAYAYRTYKDPQFLNSAIEIWDEFTPMVITTDNAVTGTHPMKNVSFMSECNNASVAGAIFYMISDSTNLDVIAGATGHYMLLSAYLFEMTNNQTYRLAASLAQTFIQSHFSDSSTGCILDKFSLSNCAYANHDLITYSSGLYLEAVTVLGNTTNDLQLVNTANRLTANIIRKFSDSFGMTESHGNDRTNGPLVTWSGMMFRGLYEHWSRSQPDSDVANLIQAFFLIQYNSIITFAQTPGKPWYSPSWRGPSLKMMVPWSQLSAIDTLNSVINLAVASPAVVSSTASSPINTETSLPEPPDETQESHKSRVGPIVGGVVGGIAVLTIISVAFFLVRRRRRMRPQTPAQYAKREADIWSSPSVNQSERLNSLPASHGSPSPHKSNEDTEACGGQYRIEPYPIVSLAAPSPLGGAPPQYRKAAW